MKVLSLLLILICGVVSPANAQDVTGLVDHADGTVTDVRSGLMWLKNANQGRMAWDQAVVWAKNLNVAGHCDWHLPSGASPDGSVCNSGTTGVNCTQTEFATLFFARTITTLSPGPFVLGPSYWTVTPWPADPTRAMVQDFVDGDQNDFPKSDTFFVWAVRNQIGPPCGPAVPSAPSGFQTR